VGLCGLLLLLMALVLLLPRRCCTCLHVLRMLLMVSCTPAFSAGKWQPAQWQWVEL
jgi:hypothetical protein